jgi:hypothetical protein
VRSESAAARALVNYYEVLEAVLIGRVEVSPTDGIHSLIIHP